MKNGSIDRAEAWLMGIDPTATGCQLKKLRQTHHLTQEKLSEHFEQGGDSASRVIISMWENGRKLPTLSHIVFLAELYGCALDELVISYRRSRECDDRDQPVLSLIIHNCPFGEHLHMRMPAFLYTFFEKNIPANPLCRKRFCRFLFHCKLTVNWRLQMSAVIWFTTK